MLRRLRQSLAILSLVPLIAVTALWLATRHAVHVVVAADEDGHATAFIATNEGVFLIRATGWPRAQPLVWQCGRGDQTRSIQFLVDRGHGERLGAEWGKGRVILQVPVGGSPQDYFLDPATPAYMETTGPAWLVATGQLSLFVITAIPPLLWLPRWIVRTARVRRWRRAGRCLFCGYDVRASGERCPECGAILAVR